MLLICIVLVWIMPILAANPSTTVKPPKLCQTGWYFYEGFCYMAINKTLSQPDAQTSCVSLGANLLSIHSQKEYQFIQGKFDFEGGMKQTIHISGTGGTCMLSRFGTYYEFWHGMQIDYPVSANHTDGTPVDYGNPMNSMQSIDNPWYGRDKPGQLYSVGAKVDLPPTYFTVLPCVVLAKYHMGGYNYWATVRCSDTFNYICKKPMCDPKSRCLDPTTTTSTTTTEKPKPNLCQNGWSYYGGFCYTVVNNSLTQPDAQASCVGLGANLVSIHSEKEQKFVQDLLAPWVPIPDQGGYRHFWNGMQIAYNPLSVNHTDGTPVDYGNPLTTPAGTGPWQGVPDPQFNHEAERCVAMDWSSHGLWFNVYCEYRNNYICKKPLCRAPNPIY